MISLTSKAMFWLLSYKKQRKRKSFANKNVGKSSFAAETSSCAMYSRIIAWVNQFRAVVDVAVQFDQTGASLPWAGVRLLLHFALSDGHCFESTVQCLESVSLLIARYAAFEALYLQKGSVIQAELQRSLVSLYARIVTFLAHGIQYFSQSTATRLVKSVFQSSQNEEIDQITKADEEVFKLTQIVDSGVQ